MEDYISITEAAKILGISRQAVFSRIKVGSLRAEKVGRQWIIKKLDIKESLCSEEEYTPKVET